MDIKFLGTAAAEGMPAVFCNCEACLNAKRLGGKNIRSRSQILVGNDLLIDFPMDTYFHMIQNSLDLSKVENIFITHAHMDHCSPMDLCMRGNPHAHGLEIKTLNIYGNKHVIKRIKNVTSGHIKSSIEKTLCFNKIKPYETIEAGQYQITTLPAVHTKKEDCLIYIISDGEKNYLQFNDSGILPDEVYFFIAKNSIKFDAVSYDCTYGIMQKGKGRHMGFYDVKSERDKMERLGILSPNCKHILTHFSHNCSLMHDEITKKVADDNFIVAYDGLKITI